MSVMAWPGLPIAAVILWLGCACLLGRVRRNRRQRLAWILALVGVPVLGLVTLGWGPVAGLMALGLGLALLLGREGGRPRGQA